MYQIRACGWWCLAGTISLLAACGEDAAQIETADKSPELRPPEPANVPWNGTAPSLAEERKAQGWRDAKALEKKAGIRLELVERGTGPAWWAVAAGDTARAVGTESSQKMDDAFDGAVSRAGRVAQARGLDPRAMRIERAAWMRLSTGSYVAWAALGDGSHAEEAPPPVNLPVETSAVAGGPGVAAPTEPKGAASLDTPAPDPDQPAWFSANPSESGGRITVGVKADAGTDREAQRLAFKAAKAKLTTMLGVEPQDVSTIKSASIKLSNGQFRAYVLAAGSAGSQRP